MLDPYVPILGLRDTERAIKRVKDHFERTLAQSLNLDRVSAPRFLEVGTGLQDDLAGTQVPVSFRVKHSKHPIEVVHSLAKWKRNALASYGYSPGTGLYTDMDAIRKDEDLSPVHSIYVDQWDWEKWITPEQRTTSYLKTTVRQIYAAIRETEAALAENFSGLRPRLPPEIHFLHSLDLEASYPDATPKEREHRAARDFGAFFLIGIGAPLASGQPHDLRAADYDDWISPGDDGRPGLNGDIIVWNHTRGEALELSSMGIRVSPESLAAQLAATGLEERRQMPFHQAVLAGELPPCIGGGIGQSRLCMLLLQKAHIGEVQASIWPDEMVSAYASKGVRFL